MWGYHAFGWGLAMVLWMLAVWVVVLLAVWIVMRNISGPKHHLRH